jgi:restriction system protein
MTLPDFQSLMLPALRFAAECNDELSIRDLSRKIAQDFRLTAEELKQPLPSGRAPQFYNRLQWAVFHLRKAGLLSTPRRAHIAITSQGRELANRGLERIDLRVLNEYPEFRRFREQSSRTSDGERAPDPHPLAGNGATPLEALEDNYQRLRSALVDDLLDRITAASPTFFEQLVVELLLEMGYGGSRADAGRALGRSGDEGIDGIIKEDRLGLDAIYIQAKRWRRDRAVGRPEIQQFAGALAGRSASKGIFLTTSRFTEEARALVEKLTTKIALVDGQELAGLMIDHGIAVTTVATYAVRRIDSDYFDEQDEGPTSS